ncbi:MFS transporter [Clostridium neonatale]|uniref:MFS transporter n=1 Tax=Clostridium neonatale TaxID=137838 RepID=UPI003D35738D
MKLFNRNFIMVLIGQIISLFGNTILRFALPLYLLNKTGSASLFGVVSACAFIPMILITPIGGIIADRVNKRNIMVILDFLTAIITLAVMILLGKVNLIILLLIALILLYGIQGAYQPAVQASVPVLVPSDGLMQANSLINIVSSLSSLIGPVIGGMLFGFLGIKPILIVSGICFLIAAIMEIFIIIPVTKKDNERGVFNIIFSDMKESFNFILNDRPEILKGSLIISAFNLVLSACVMIGLPIIITQKMGFQLETANRLYGYIEGAMGAGSLTGGIIGGVFAKKIKIKNCSLLLVICSLSILPIALVLSFNLPVITSYVIIMISSFVMMMLATLFSIQLMSCLQMLTPNKLLGKVISCVMCISMCATPVGQAFYGMIFQKFSNIPQTVFFGALSIGVIIGICTIKLFRNLEETMHTNYSEI